MLRLTLEQQQRLEALALARDLQRVGAVLAQAFPEVAARLGERLPALLLRARERALAAGLRHGLCLARYLAAWFVFGADFEQQPDHAWARALLDRPGDEGGRIFQLGRRCIEELRARQGQPGLPAAATFEASLALLDAELAGIGALGSLLPRLRLKLGQPCDVGALQVDLPDTGWRRHYIFADHQWRLAPAAPAQPAVTADTQRPLPPRLHLLAHAAGSASGQATLRVRTRMLACCDAEEHPLVTFDTEQERRAWRGTRATDLRIAMAGEAPPDGIAVAATPRLSRLTVAACGLRESGLPVGSPETLVATWPADQQLLTWRREAGAPVELPGAPPPAASPQARSESNGESRPARPHLETLGQLDTQLAQGLQSLLRAWERGTGLTQARLHAEPAVLAGTAGVAWGWAEAAQPVQDAPWMRVAAAVDLVVWQLQLRLTGRLQFADTQTQLTLQAGGAERLQCDWQNAEADADLAAALGPMQVAFRQPLALSLQALAGSEAALTSLVEPVDAAIVGSAGLRVRQDGPGLQWFVKAGVEAVNARLQVRDPLLGEEIRELALLPESPLIDWSLA